MQFLIYIIVYPFLWLISILPFRLLYALSDVIYLLVFHIIKYRRQTVKDNLTLVFPNKSDAEIKRITKKFYSHLCDMLLEMIKTMSISEKELKRRFIFTNPEELKRLEALNRSIVLISAHYASWEWAFVIQNYLHFSGYAVYKKLENPYFDKLVRRIRSKYNTTLISTKETYKVISENEQNGIKSIFGFLSDQSPKLHKALHWTEFMNIKVPCYVGAEVIAKNNNLVTAYLKITKLKRGFYKAEMITLTENPNDYEDYALTDLFLKEVEKQIYKAPEYYFWTHKRWKHRNKNAS